MDSASFWCIRIHGKNEHSIEHNNIVLYTVTLFRSCVMFFVINGEPLVVNVELKF